MNTRTFRQLSVFLLAILFVGTIGADASAQTTIVAPTPGDIEAVSPLPSYILALLLVGAALALTVLPSKRSHED